ncbi:MAG TPA: hypothetical protein VGD91_26770 [Trebonia sp.]
MNVTAGPSGQSMAVDRDRAYLVEGDQLVWNCVSVDDLQVAADLLVDIEKRLPGNRLVLKIVPGGRHHSVPSLVKAFPVVRGQPAERKQ